MAEDEQATSTKAGCQEKDKKQNKETNPESPTESIETFLKDMQVLQKILAFVRYIGMFLFVWLLGWLGFSCLWVLIATLGYYMMKTNWEKRKEKQEFVQACAKDEEDVIRARLGDLPSWVRIKLSSTWIW